MLVVFGSINIDLVFRVPRLPRDGETILGETYVAVPGGKGANQAVAAARDGARVAMAGRVGDDGFGAQARDSLVGAGVDISRVVTGSVPTGCAAIAVDPAGANQIMVAAGANARATADQVEDALLAPETTLLLQMEVPARENAALIARAKQRGARIVLNLAPAAALSEAAIGSTDVVVVNEGEAAWLARSRQLSPGKPSDVALALSRSLNATMVLTLGASGAVAAHRGEAWTVGALPIAPVDTTGAGDAFVGVLAAALDGGATFQAALRRASVAAGLACLTLGAQPSLPTQAAIDGRLAELAPPVRVGT